MSKRWKAVTGEETNRPYLPDLAWSAALFLMLLVPVTMRWDPLAEFDRVVVAALSDPVARLDTAHSVVNAVTFVGGGEVSALLLSLATVWFLFRRANRSALYVALAGLGAAILDQGVKALVERARPVLDVAVAAPGASFPSGHTMNATITYGVLLLVLWPALPSHRRRLAVGVAVSLVTVVGLTRVLLGVHHPSDVAAGWTLGVVWLGLTNLVLIAPRPPHGPDDLPQELGPPLLEPAPLPGGWMSAARLVVVATLMWGALIVVGASVSATDGPVLRFDTAALEWLESARTTQLTDVVDQIGRLGGTAGIVAGLLVAVVATLAGTRRWRPAVYLVVAVVGETVMFLATAAVVERPRPSIDTLAQSLPPTTSFPSGHAAAATALYGAAAYLVVAWTRNRGLRYGAVVVACLVAVGVGIARLYSGLHHPTDVLASWVYAVVWLLAAGHVLRPGPDPDSETAPIEVEPGDEV